MSSAGLILFDCDGVLVDSERLMQDVDIRMITELGWAVTREEMFAQFLGRSEMAGVASIERNLGRPVPATFVEDRRAAHIEEFRAGLTEVPGVGDAVVRLQKAGYATCVASSASHERLRLMLELTDLRGLFEGRVFSADDVERGKPAPDLFLHAAETMGYGQNTCVVVEDSPSGVAAARAAGMLVVGFCGLTPTQALAGADVLVSDMRDLEGAIRGLTGPIARGDASRSLISEI